MLTPTEERQGTLAPGSVETLWYLLQMQYEHRTRWIERYFPKIADRGTLTYEDIDGMTRSQAEAVRHLLTEETLYMQAKRRKVAARGVAFRDAEDTVEERNREYALRIRTYEDALADVCRVYRLDSPHGG